MANCFLRLDIKHSGVFAQIVEQKHKRNTVLDSHFVLFEELSQTDTDTDLFTTAMDSINEQLDISFCTNAVLFMGASVFNFRNIDQPFVSHKKIKQILPFELESTLPLNNESYLHDFHQLTCLQTPNLLKRRRENWNI